MVKQEEKETVKNNESEDSDSEKETMIHKRTLS